MFGVFLHTGQGGKAIQGGIWRCVQHIHELGSQREPAQAQTFASDEEAYVNTIPDATLGLIPREIVCRSRHHICDSTCQAQHSFNKVAISINYFCIDMYVPALLIPPES